jgi:hypothetical protein
MFTDHIHDQLGRYRVGAINDSMPEFVKEAEEQIVTENLEKLADGCFAYSDGVNRYFPLHTPQHVWMSHAYFEKFANEFNEQTSSMIRERIEDAYKAFELPESNIVKIAAEEDEIDAIHSLSIELNKFIDEYKKYPVHYRRAKAKELLHYAKALGKQSSLHDVVYRYAGDHFKKDYTHAFADRMKHFSSHAPEREALLKMQDESPNHIPELVAKALSIFDTKTGLHKYYDQSLDDPYVGLLSPFDGDNEEDIHFGEHSVPANKLKKFNFETLKEFLSDDLLSQLKTNPVETLRNADPAIRVIVIRKINA